MFGLLLTTLRSVALGGLLVLGFALDASASGTTALVSVRADTPGLQELGLALDHVTHQGDLVAFAANDWERAQLEQAGIAYRVLIADLEGFYAERLRAESALWAGSNPADAPGFGFGSMGGYYTRDEVVDKLDEMRRDYPALITAKQSLGVSHEGRDVWMAMISDNPDNVDEHEPAILFTGLTHAREPMGMEVQLYTMFHLLENYGIDPEVTYLIDERQLYFVPIVNPDGYVYNETTNPSGGGMWRKNRRDSGGGVFGVDLNRNYGYLWGYNNSGSSPNPAAGNYRGPGPFSEPATSAIRTFHLGPKITTAYHYHAYGGYLIHPYAYMGSALPPQPDLDLYLRYGSELQAMHGYQLGNFFQTLKYLANGEVLDWCYGEQTEKDKVMGFLPEVGSGSDGFWPQTSRIVPLAELHREPNIYWAWMAGSCGELVQVNAGPMVTIGKRASVEVEVENRGYGATARDLSVTLASSDPHVTIITPQKPFPELPALQTGSNAGDPLQFFVAASAPVGHVIILDVSLLQGDVVRGQTTVQVTTQ